MNNEKRTLCDRLLQIEEAPDADEPQQQLEQILEGKLSPARRATLALCTLFCVTGAFRLAHLALHPAPGWPPAAVAGLTAGAVVAVVWAAFLAVAVKRGRIGRRRTPVILERLLTIILVVGVGGTTFVGLGMSDPLRGTQVLVVEVIVLLIAISVLIQNRTGQAELRTRQKLLEIEIRIRRISERLETSASPREVASGYAAH